MMEENPYKTPDATLADNEEYVRKRTGWVWVIIIYQSFTLAAGSFMLFVIYSGKIPLPAKTRHFYDNLNLFDKLLSSMNMLFIFLFVISLFMLKKSATKILIVSFVYSIMLFVYNAVFNELLSVYTAGSWIMVFVGYTLQAAIILYCKKLERRKILI